MSKRQAPPVVWLITDNKPGHRNQLKGLAERLAALTGARFCWLHAEKHPVPLWRALLGIAPALNASLPRPDLILSAGSKTHRLLLALRRTAGASALVLMKPGFPVSWVDGAIIPAHDRVKPSANVLVTEGALNAVKPLTEITDQKNALVLIGGPSPHFTWDSMAVFSQISELVARHPDWHWQITDSRRTPAELANNLDSLQGMNVEVQHHQQTPEGWLNQQLAHSRAVWVTPDSLSMVCEAATSGVPTGLLDLPAQPNSRVAKGVQRLAEKDLVFPMGQQASIMAEQIPRAPRLWEADRAARWVIERFL